MSIKIRRRLMVWRALLCVSYVAHLVITIFQPDVGMVCLWVWLAINWLSLELIWAVELLLTYTKGDCGPRGEPLRWESMSMKSRKELVDMLSETIVQDSDVVDSDTE